MISVSSLTRHSFFEARETAEELDLVKDGHQIHVQVSPNEL
jgi:hypothetical protein